MIRTRFTEMFGLNYPIMSAPMSEHSGGTLAAAVSAAGALGSFGGVTGNGPDWVREQIGIIRERTDKVFAVGFLTHFLPFMGTVLDVALEERVPAVAFSFSDPAPYAKRAIDAGARIICQVQTMDDARLAVDSGAEVLVAQGNEAGGHTGRLPLLPFLVEVRNAWPDMPVLAAGGVATGQSLAAVLTAGADGAWMGTPLVAATETEEVPEVRKRAIVSADSADSIYTGVFDLLDVQAWGIPPWPEGIAARVLRNETVEQWHGREKELAAQIEPATEEFKEHLQQDEMRWRPIYAGPSAGSVHAIRPAADIIKEICTDAERILRERSDEILA
jgi:nitronate monooxygenase